MKLGELNSAIRNLDGNPWMLPLAPTPSGRLKVYVQKTPLLAELKEAYPAGRSTETGIELTADGRLVRAGWTPDEET